MPVCPRCQSERIVKNGYIHNGTPKFACRACGRQFVESPAKRVISNETRALVDSLLLKRMPAAEIARMAKVSPAWLQSYVNRKHTAQKHQHSAITRNTPH